MQFGFGAPISGPLSSPDALGRLAAEGEAMGFGYLTFSDHLVIPTDISVRYPYTEGGEFPQGARGGRHEQLTAVAFVAGKTRRIRLVTSVMVVPHRPAVLAAKILATIDRLSEGRLTVGIGAGWLKEEFEAIGAPPFAERGAVTDEYVQAMRVLWTEAQPRFQGRHVGFENIVFEPKPVQTPHPPIWVGGESGPAMRRTARLGNGWYPIGTNPQHPLDSLARLRAAIEKLRRLTAEAKRDPAAIAVAYRVQSFGRNLPDRAGDGERRLFSGAPGDSIDDIRAMGALGVGAIDFSFAGDSVEAALGDMQRLWDEVLAKTQ